MWVLGFNFLFMAMLTSNVPMPSYAPWFDSLHHLVQFNVGQKKWNNNPRMLKLVWPTKKCNHIKNKNKKDTLGYGFKLTLLQNQ